MMMNQEQQALQIKRILYGKYQYDFEFHGNIEFDRWLLGLNESPNERAELVDVAEDQAN